MYVCVSVRTAVHWEATEPSAEIMQIYKNVTTSKYCNYVETSDGVGGKNSIKKEALDSIANGLLFPIRTMKECKYNVFGAGCIMPKDLTICSQVWSVKVSTHAMNKVLLFMFRCALILPVYVCVMTSSAQIGYC